MIYAEDVQAKLIEDCLSHMKLICACRNWKLEEVEGEYDMFVIRTRKLDYDVARGTLGQLLDFIIGFQFDDDDCLDRD